MFLGVPSNSGESGSPIIIYAIPYQQGLSTTHVHSLGEVTGVKIHHHTTTGGIRGCSKGGCLLTLYICPPTHSTDRSKSVADISAAVQ